MSQPDPVRQEIRGRAMVVTIDNPPVNVIGHAVRTGLDAAFDAAEQALAEDRIDRLVITGAGRAFVAGADAKEFDSAPRPPHLPDVLNRLETLPAIAAINGAALGGGFEIALACRVRLAAPGAVLGLPEVTLGVVPGAGGTQRLPRLVGLETALPLIAQGRTLKAPEAAKLGLVDALEDDPLAAALTLEAAALAADPPGRRPAPAAAPEAVEAARAQAGKRQRGQTAPLRAIELVEAAARLPLDEGLALERAAFLDLREGAQARALRHVFFAERAAGAGPELKALRPAEIRSALIAGGGTMGAAIAYALWLAGIEVTLLEQDAAAEDRARANIEKLLQQGEARGKLSAEAAANARRDIGFVSGAETPLPPVDLAVEAVFEDLAVKRALFARLDAALPETTILATNTSYLDPNAIAEGISHPGRFLGLHFFAPAHVMKLVEVVRAETTAPATLAAGFALTRRLGKIAVEAGVCDGFIGNRILTRYRQAGDVLLLEGALPWEVDAAMQDFGMAMGPYAVQDLSGLDIAYANRRRKNLKEDPAHRYVPVADRMVERLERLGRKTGAGWYDYDAEGRPRPAPEVQALVEEASREAATPRAARPPEQLARRLVLAMIAEGYEILGEGIARNAGDIDLVMIHGYGFPRWRGGPMHLAGEWGLAQVAADLAALAEEDPRSWRVPPLLAERAAE
jgi:3-hydroxyacyl-CoA dehydrogenase